MDTSLLNKHVEKIKVTNLENADVEVVNNSPLKMMGKGRQGAVFQFTNDICVKVFGNEEDCEREYQALSLGQHTNLFPKLHGRGPLHIAMEIVRGVDLREYLQSQPLTKELSAKLIQMLIVFKEIGFERIDHHKRQIYLQNDGSLKVIDVARTIWRDRVYPYPRKLLNSLGEEYKALFLEHVQEFAPSLYEEWKHYIEMEEQSRELIKVISSQAYDKEAIKKASERLRTSNEKPLYEVGLENLVYKVFKDEWVKAMLAMGYNPDQVKDQMDAYWAQYEQAKTDKELLSEVDQEFKEKVFKELIDSKDKGKKKEDKEMGKKKDKNKKSKSKKVKETEEQRKKREAEEKRKSKEELFKKMLSIGPDLSKTKRKK
ncbi:hypothetical protein [Bacillus dakarensis]|uniref:hypothetical protein n=1 Tax=Robertmurraya dakarensis TaxID=1926278 RepID=UPI000981AD68|nr:hypothetical protein [Bacillus dakarensis]